MKIIQILLLFFVVLTLFVVRQKRGYLSRTFSRFGFLLVSFLFFGGILFPNVFQRLARLVGVGRGADLLIYLNTIATFSATLLIFVKVKQIEAREALIVREIALLQIREPNKA